MLSSTNALAILMDKAIIIGTDHETSGRSLPFTLFKIQTSTHLFLPQFLRHHLVLRHLDSALTLASNYEHLIYFAHALEILLHAVLEDEHGQGMQCSSGHGPTATGDLGAPRVGGAGHMSEAAGTVELIREEEETDARNEVGGEEREREEEPLLPAIIEFLDYFPQSLEVVVGCARKTEIDRWGRLFSLVGDPREMFELCIREGKLRTAGSFLLVLHNLEEVDGEGSGEGVTGVSRWSFSLFLSFPLSLSLLIS